MWRSSSYSACPQFFTLISMWRINQKFLQLSNLMQAQFCRILFDNMIDRVFGPIFHETGKEQIILKQLISSPSSQVSIWIHESHHLSGETYHELHGVQCLFHYCVVAVREMGLRRLGFSDYRTSRIRNTRSVQDGYLSISKSRSLSTWFSELVWTPDSLLKCRFSCMLVEWSCRSSRPPPKLCWLLNFQFGYDILSTQSNLLDIRSWSRSKPHTAQKEVFVNQAKQPNTGSM